VTSAQSKAGGARVRFPPPLVFVVWIGVGVLLQRFVLRGSLPIAPTVRVVLGVVVALAGLAFGAPAIRQLRRTGQDPAPWLPSPELVVAGIYRHSRNPIYVGMTILQLGIGVALGNPWIAGLAAAGLLTVHFVAVRPEEAYLAEKFGEPYLRYKAAVRRYV
jgi:protein-S-isoprenylcysteine O-methyltransferase Ste14